jgi:hippurate hydrolase
MAAADRFEIVVRGKGAHAALPHQTPDAVLAAADLVTQLHTIVSRRVPPTHNAVLSVTRISGGQSHNVLPSAVELTGTVRSFDATVQDRIEEAIRNIAAGVARGSGTRIEVEYVRYYPATVNSDAQAQLALEAARSAGLQATLAPAPAFTSEDFAFMLQERPGAYLWLGQGRGKDTVSLHHPAYDFNDDALAGGVRWFVSVAQLALGGARDAV